MVDASGLKDAKYRDAGLVLEDQKVAAWLDGQAKQQG
jgi:hypothetical protein